MTESYLLGVILFAPFVGAAVLATPWVSNRHPLLVRQLAAFFAGISFFASFYLLLAFDWQKGGYQFQQKYVWSEQLGIQFYIGVDGIGVPMVLASSILLFAGVFISDRKSTRLNSSHLVISYAVFCLKKKKIYVITITDRRQIDHI